MTDRDTGRPLEVIGSLLHDEWLRDKTDRFRRAKNYLIHSIDDEWPTDDGWPTDDEVEEFMNSGKDF